MVWKALRFLPFSNPSALRSAWRRSQTRYFDLRSRLPCVFGRVQGQSKQWEMPMCLGYWSLCSARSSHCWSMRLVLMARALATVTAVNRDVVGWEVHLLMKKDLGLERECCVDLPFQSPSRHPPRNLAGHHLSDFLTLSRMKRRLARWALWMRLERRWKVVVSLVLTARIRPRLVCLP